MAEVEMSESGRFIESEEGKAERKGQSEELRAEI
jgi:hypothetical protein